MAQSMVRQSDATTVTVGLVSTCRESSSSGFLIAALLGLGDGLGWMGCQFVRNQFGG